MRLETLRVKNFRSCYDTTVQFAEHLTLLVGENDAGKSNIIDAIRAAVPAASGRPTLWFERDRDLSYETADGELIEVSRTYSDLTVGEDAFYTPALVDLHRKLVHTTGFNTDSQLARRHRLVFNVGDQHIADPEPENRDRIAHVYLQPLRDAATALDSAGGNRLADVFRVIASPDEISAFEDKANLSLGELAEDDTAKKVVDGVQTHLTAVTRPVRHRLIDVKHRRQRLASLARSLRLHMAAEGLAPSDLLGSGLGYANLLFIATVVLELERADEFDLLLLLVEEPEAHLHPQLQTVLLDYLQEQAELSVTAPAEDGAPAGRIQVIATTHSPHLTSSLSTRHVVVVRCRDRELPDMPDDAAPSESDVPDTDSEAAADYVEEPTAAVSRHTETVTVSLSELKLNGPARRKVDRYLDATRAALLFARQVVLVEGIAEAMLLRSFAERLVYPPSADEAPVTGLVNRQLREQFRAISVLPIGGVDFLPFLQLLLHSNVALADRVVVVTDGDGAAGNARRDRILESFQPFFDSGCLSVVVGTTTLEAELFAAPQNEALLRQAFETQHPQSLEKWDALVPAGEISNGDRAKLFSEALKSGKLDLGKGDFAHVISELVATTAGATDFQLPGYLEEAIRAAVIKPVAAATEGGEDAAA